MQCRSLIMLIFILTVKNIKTLIKSYLLQSFLLFTFWYLLNLFGFKSDFLQILFLCS